jgi:2-dehydropantoate 2-reductase
VRVLIVGLGVIGTGYGWAFRDYGHDVRHLLRPGRAAQVPRRILLDVLDMRPGRLGVKTHAYRPVVTETVSDEDGFDLVIVPVKHYQVGEALRQLTASLPDARYLLFAANWDGLAEVDALLPRAQYAWGYSASTGGHAGSTLVFNMSPTYRCGPIDGAEPEWVSDVVHLFETVSVTQDRKPDVREWLWVHFAQAAGSIGSTLYAGGLAQFYEDVDGLRDRMVPAVRECLDVLAARGVDPAAWPDVAPFVTRPAAEIAASVHGTLTTPWVQRTLAAGHFMENADEMRRFYLDVLATGEALGVPMPLMRSFRERIVAGG